MVEHTSYDKFIGAVVGNYRLESIIERHPWGPLFLARGKTGTGYVVRFVDTPLAGSDASPDARLVFLGRFQQEANRVAMLQHPHILALHDYGNYEGIPYLVYSHMPLVSLRALLTQKVPGDLLVIGRYLDQIASALEHAHEYAVLHRNLSTNCIYMQDNRQMIVAEFGLLRMRELGRQGWVEDKEPVTGQTYEGSSESSAPEQLLGRPIDVYTDIYALGAVLYRLLTGQPPFSGKTREEISRQHLYAEVPSLSTCRPDLPSDLDRIVARAMAKEPLQRFHRPSEITQAYYRVVAPHLAPAVMASGAVSLAASGKMPVSKAAERPVSRDARQSKPVAAQRPVTGQPQRVSRRNVITILAAGGGIGAVAVAAAFGTHLLGGAAPAPTTANGPANGAATQSGNGNGAAPQGGNGKPAGKATQAPRQQANALAKTADVPKNSAKAFPIANQKNPGLIIHLSDDRFVAFDSTCTHQGCAVAYNPQTSLLKCPCHEAIFDPAKNAAVVSGPAPSPLTPIAIKVNADGTITQG